MPPNQSQARLGLIFNDPAWLEEALTHPSYRNEHPDLPLPDNERLEFLGDAFLGQVVAQELFGRLPQASEGQLTQLRAALVRREALARAATSLGLGAHLRLGRGEERGGGRRRPANLAAAFEALVGAVLLDQGAEAASRFVLTALSDELTKVLKGEPWLDVKSRLQQLIQAQGQPPPRYRLLSAKGPDHDRRFTMAVVVGERTLAVGGGKSKQEAEKAAAAAALRELDVLGKEAAE